MLFLTFYSSELLATEKEKIIKKLKETRSISFNFTQKTNSVIENGWCILAFPNKLKCVYDDKKQKELILNNNTLSITQKRYDKTFLYPVSKSPFLIIRMLSIILRCFPMFIMDRLLKFPFDQMKK